MSCMLEEATDSRPTCLFVRVTLFLTESIGTVGISFIG